MQTKKYLMLVLAVGTLWACESKNNTSKRTATEQTEDPLFPSEWALDNATGASTLITPDPSAAITKTTVKFSWDAAPGATRYFLSVGTSLASVNKSPWGDIFALSMASNRLNADVSNIPVRGEPVYVRLWTMLNGKWSSIYYTITTQTTNEEIGKTVDKLTQEALAKLDNITVQNQQLAAQNAALAAQNSELKSDLTAAKDELKTKIEEVQEKVSDVEGRIENNASKTLAFAECVISTDRQKIYGESSLDLLDDCKLWATTVGTATSTWTLESAGTMLTSGSAYIRGRCLTAADAKGYMVGKSSLEIRRACIAAATQSTTTFRAIADLSIQEEQESTVSSSQLICEPTGPDYSYVVRRSDLSRLGAYVTNNDCASIVRNARNGLVCEPSSFYYGYGYISRISDKSRISGQTTLAACNAAVRSSRPALTCVPTDSYWSKMLNLTTNTYVGSSTEHSQCIDNVISSRAGLVCSAYDNYWSKIIRLADNEQLGSLIADTQCNKHVANTSNNVVCAPNDNYWSRLMKIDSKEYIGNYLSHSDCLNLPK